MAALHAKDPSGLEMKLRYLTPPALAELERDMMAEITASSAAGQALGASPSSSSVATQIPKENDDWEQQRDVALARGLIRRIVQGCLSSKLASSYSPEEIEDALKYHTLPEQLQTELAERYDQKAPKPKTWYEALEQLKSIANNDTVKLWELVLEHPMTSYVPMQCRDCGHVIPDVASTAEEDVRAGLVEVTPNGTELGLCGGWFRGRPQTPKVFALECPQCGSTSTRWYRSNHPRIILNPNRWGRLCGEQEDMRMMLATYLKIKVRLCIPLDWDHVWSEFYDESSERWDVGDGNDRNFAVRLNEGIGAWTGIWAIHANDPKLCEDVTSEYLKCQSNGGRADDLEEDDESNQMEKFRNLVEEARKDATASATQAKTLNGYVLERANFTSETITDEMRRAVTDYHNAENSSCWWEL